LRLLRERSGHYANHEERLANINSGTTLNYRLDHLPSFAVSSWRGKVILFHGLEGTNQEFGSPAWVRLSLGVYSTNTSATHAHPQTSVSRSGAHFHPQERPRNAGQR